MLKQHCQLFHIAAPQKFVRRHIQTSPELKTHSILILTIRKPCRASPLTSRSPAVRRCGDAWACGRWSLLVSDLKRCKHWFTKRQNLLKSGMLKYTGVNKILRLLQSDFQLYVYEKCSGELKACKHSNVTCMYCMPLADGQNRIPLLAIFRM